MAADGPGDATSPSRSTPRSAWLALLAIVAFGGWLRVHHLGADCFDGDELYAVRVAGADPKSLAAVVARDGLRTNHPPLMTVPFQFWNAAVGHTEAAVRAWACLCGILAVPVVFAVARALAGNHAGLAAAAFLTANPLAVTYSQEARQYGLLVLLVAVAHLFAVRSFRSGKRLDLLGYFAVSSWALSTHYFAAPALFGHLAWGLGLLLSRDAAVRSAGLNLIGALGLAGLTLAGWLPMAAHQSRQEWNHLSDPTLLDVLNATAHIAGVVLPGQWWLWACGGLFALLAVAVTDRRRRLVFAEQSGQSLFPRRLGWVAVGAGVLSAVGVLALAGRVLDPLLRNALAATTTDPSQAAEEIAVIHRTLVGYSLALVAIGGVVLAWRWLKRQLDARLGGALPGGWPTTTGFALFAWLAAPALTLAALTALGVPVFSTRNLLALTPALAVAVGAAADRLLASWPGRVAAVVAVGVYVAGVLHYDAVAVPLGFDRGGHRKGIDTPDWRELAAWLRASPDAPPVATVRSTVSDPALYYLADRPPIRFAPGGPFHDLPPQFLLVRWEIHQDGYPGFAYVEDDLRAAGYRLREVRRFPQLVVLDASR